MPIHVIDALMGKGKTTFAHNLMNELAQGDTRFIYITVTEAERDRAIAACPGLRMKEPKPIHGRKLWHLPILIRDRQNISSTHQLFQRLTRPIYEQLAQDGRYILIIDEALDVVDQYPISKPDLRMLLETEMVFVDPMKRLRWNHDRYPGYTGKHEDVMGLCDNGNLVKYRDTVLIWEFPADFLNAFQAVYVCTYMFEGSLMAHYLRANGVDYTLSGLVDGKPQPFASVDNSADKAALAQLLTVVDDARMNAIGAGENALSSGWHKLRCQRDSAPALRAEAQQLRNNLGHFFRRIARTPSRLNMWTTFKSWSGQFGGVGYKKGFVSANAKGTNDYRHKATAAYAINKFLSPIVRGYFEGMGIPVREDLFALTEMLQWIWRGRIREKQPMTLYIPSERQRSLFHDWLNNSDAALVHRAANELPRRAA